MTTVDFEGSKKGWVAISLDFKWDLKSGRHLLKIWTNIVKNHLKSGQKHPDFK